jgi:hypothetical protein
MITTSDIADILYEACMPFGMDIYRRGAIPDGIVTSERVIILPKEQSPQTYWKKSFVEVDICVPDISEGVADVSRLQEIERMAQGMLDGITGEYDSDYYRYGIESISGINRDDSMKCHYVNVRLLFEVLNC